jgi:hypothetical protein
MAHVAISIRERKPSVVRMRSTWVATVRGVTIRRAAISRLSRASTMRPVTSRSRAERGAARPSAQLGVADEVAVQAPGSCGKAQ